MSSVTEQFSAYGHPDVTATHRTTFEITTEDHLTPAGTCIIAICSEKGAASLSPQFCDLLRVPGSRLLTSLICQDVTVTIRSEGNPGLTLIHPTDLVWRRSSFICGRTIGLYSDHTAATLPCEMIAHLQQEARLDVVLTVVSDDSPGIPTTGV